MTPIKRTTKLISDFSKIKERGRDLRSRIRKEVTDITDSNERKNAIVFKYFTDKNKLADLLKNVKIINKIE